MSEAPTAPNIESPLVNENPEISTKVGIEDNWEKQPKYARALRKVFSSPERASELFSAYVMQGLELLHDMKLYPAKYSFGPGQVGSLPNPNTNPQLAWAIDHIGDIWEISVGFAALRIGFVAVNEALKNDRVKNLQKEFLGNDKTRKFVSKIVGTDKINKLAEGQEVQIPDEVCFWTSLGMTVAVKAIHSLGYISLFHIHDHMGAPVPGMLFGQGVAAVVLAASHYTGKYHESIKDLALRVGGKVVEGVKFAGGKFKKFNDKIGYTDKLGPAPSVATDINEQGKEI